MTVLIFFIIIITKIVAFVAAVLKRLEERQVYSLAIRMYNPSEMKRGEGTP